MNIHTPAFTASAYALFSVSKKSCKVCPGRHEMGLIPAIRKESLLQSIFLSSLFSQGTTGLTCTFQVSRGLARATLA